MSVIERFIAALIFSVIVAICLWSFGFAITVFDTLTFSKWNPLEWPPVARVTLGVFWFGFSFVAMLASLSTKETL